MLRNSGIALALGLSACFTTLIQASPTPTPTDVPEFSSSSSSPPSTCPRGEPGTISYTANFEDLPAIISPRSQVPVPYAGLNHSLWYVEEYHGFTIPASGSKYAISYDYRQAREINTVFPGSRVVSFHLQSLHYACSQGVPQPECTIVIRGHKWRGPRGNWHPQILTKTVTYPALNPPVDPATIVMKQVVFGPEWRNLEKVTFDVTGEQPEYAGLVLDQVAYQTVECPPESY